MLVNIAETFGLLFDKNNNVAIKLLPNIAKHKPELKNDILSALHNADISIYADSMQSLVYKDIQKALEVIQKS